MKNGKTISVILTLVTAFAIVGAVTASSALPGSGWYTGITIQNVGTGTATISVTSYDSTSPSSTYAYTNTVSVGNSLGILPTNISGMPSGFQGSAIVSSDQDIRAIVNVTNRFLSGPGLGDPNTVSAAAGQYQGINAGGTSVSFALAKLNHFNKTTTFYIQNAGSGNATTTAVFKMPSNLSSPTTSVTAYTYTTPSLVPGQMVAINPADGLSASSQNPPAGNNAVGSLTVTSAQPIAGVVLEHKHVETNATVLQATRGFTPSDYGSTVYAPTNKNNYFNRFTGLQVQNVSGGSVNVTVTYNGAPGTPTNCAGQTFSDTRNGLTPGESHTFPSTALPSGCLAAATITASGNIVAVVNESYTSAFLAANPSRQQESTTYSAFAGTSATTRISLPVYKEDSFSKGTGVTVQNVGGSTATNVVAVFTSPAGTFTTAPQTISSGSSTTFVDTRNKPIWSGTAMTPAALGCTTSGCGANGTFGVIITSDQPIVAISNESTYPFTAPRINQDKNNYEGFNLTP